MAYYDQFTKKPHSKRDDWRDDELTHRPQRDEGRGVPTERRRAEHADARDRRPGMDRPYEQRSRGDRPYGDRPYEQRAHGERPRADRPYAERAERRDRRPGAPERAPRGTYRDERPVRPEGRPAPRQEQPPMPPEERENLLVGRNPIREALRSGRDMEKLLVARGELIGSAREIVAMAREQHVVVQEVDRARLDAMAPNHQGLIAVVSAFAYRSVEDMLALAKSRGEDPLLVMLDGVTDPHNLGAIIRSAECAGAHGVIIPERRAVGLTPAAVKASAGAVEYIPVARETNLTRTIERLKKEGIWIYGAAMEGEDYRKVDFAGPAALVIGSEGEGISRLVAQNCDRLISLPIRGKIDSLNASVAAGVLLYAMTAVRV